MKRALVLALLLPSYAYAEPCDRKCLVEKKQALEAELAAVEARLEALDSFWLSLDLGLDVLDGVYTSAGLSIPAGPLTLSAGVWGGADAIDSFHKGWYVSVGYSITLID